MKVKEIKLDSFSLEIGLFNSLSYCFLTAAATYVDSNYEHAVYGFRVYPLGYFVILFWPLIFYLTYVFNSKKNISAIWKSIFTLLSLVIPIFILMYTNFQPEFPHMSLLGGTIAYALILASAVYVHNYEHNLNIIDNKSIDNTVKLKAIEFEYNTWHDIFLALLAGFSLWILTFLQNSNKVDMINPGHLEEQLLITRALVSAFLLSGFFALFLLIEVIKKLQFIKNQLIRIHKE
jgi:hypothetical protein